MKNFIKLAVVIVFCFACSGVYAQEEIDTRIDNWRYWKEKAEQGYIPFNSDEAPKPAKPAEDENRMMDTPDVLILGGSTTQSENSVFVNPIDNQISLNSNNSQTGASFSGTSALFTFDGGLTWTGGSASAGGSNSGDPAVAIDLNGTSYIGHIANGGGQGVAISNNNGATWSTSVIASGATGFLDKNHLWVDNGTSSPFQGNLYSAWTNFGGANYGEIEVSRSTDNGVTWSAPVTVSAAIGAGSHNQGVNIQTGPNGDVYAVWAIYDSWPSRENAIGFARSTDGGATFGAAVRIHNNIQGVRWQPGFPIANPHGKNMRSNSFPGMATDISTGANSGTIYVVWSNVGVPGVNTGTDVSIYMMSSTDNGVTWSTPSKVNQDPIGNVQYFPWIASDPVNGNLSVIFYDDRNVAATDAEAWVANSTDGGTSWSDNRVSDVSFTPAPIPGLAGGYMGDYLGISARDGQVYPVWSDNRSGAVLAYTSPYVLASCLANLNITLNVAPGGVDHQEASSTITASNTIASGAEGVYHAGDEVLLTSDFDAINGSVFRAYIEGCSGSFVRAMEQKGDYVKADKARTTKYFKEDAADISMAVYPNPTSSIFTIELEGHTLDDFNVEIYSMSRGLMFANQFEKENLNSFQVDISEFPEGIYIVRLTSSKDDKTFTGRIIKNN